MISSPDALLPPIPSKIDVQALDPNWRSGELGAMLMGYIWEREAVRKLETRIKKLSGSRYALSYDSGRSALTAGLRALGVDRVSEVILPSYVCSTVANAVVSAALKPCLVDVGPDHVISPEAVEKAITPNTCAVIAPHLYGRLCKMERLQEIAAEHDLFLIDDAAQALGAKLGSKMAGTLGDFGILSFGPGKISQGIGGGVLLTDDDEIYKSLARSEMPSASRSKSLKKSLSYLAVTRLRRVSTVYRFWKWRHRDRTYPGAISQRPPKEINPKSMSPPQAAVCLKTLSDLDRNLEARKSIGCALHHALADVEGLRVLEPQAGMVFGAYPVCSMREHRYVVASRLALAYVETLSPYYPLHLRPAYSSLIRIGSAMHLTELALRSLVVLPVHPRIHLNQVEKMAGLLKESLGQRDPNHRKSGVLE